MNIYDPRKMGKLGCIHLFAGFLFSPRKFRQVHLLSKKVQSIRRKASIMVVCCYKSKADRVCNVNNTVDPRLHFPLPLFLRLRKITFFTSSITNKTKINKITSQLWWSLHSIKLA